MPKSKDLKKIVRARMEKTGESYTAARMQTLRKKETQAPDYAALSGVSEAALQKATGRTWSEWVQLLDAFGAKEKPHRDIARFVLAQGNVSGWWSQSVSVGYERIRGLRAIGQRRSGTWEANKSRTIAAPAAVLFDAIANTRKRAKWMGGVKLTVRSSSQKSIRAVLDDGTAVQFYIDPKGEAKSTVTVQHVKLAEKAGADRMKLFWGEKLNALAEVVAR